MCNLKNSLAKNAKLFFGFLAVLSMLLNAVSPVFAAGSRAPSVANFSYGVLAVNTGQTYYEPGQNVLAQMGSLDSKGHTICNSNLELGVIGSDNQITKFSTADGGIKRSSSCGNDNVTNNPDYFTNFTAGAAGQYQLVLKNLDTGLQVNNTFFVKDNLPFTVQRATATRINPFKSAYTVNLKITAKENFDGQAEEFLQNNFIATNFGGAGLSSGLDENGKTWQRLAWPVSLKAGESANVSYEYQAPLSSPDFFKLGFLQLRSKTISQILNNQPADNSGAIIYAEQKPWEIASDVTETAIATGGWFSTGTWSNNIVPSTTSDTAQIGGNFTVTATSSVSVGTLNFLSTSTGATLSVNTGITVTVSGATTFLSSTSISATSTITGAGTLTTNSMSVGNAPVVASGGTGTTTATSSIANLNITTTLKLLSGSGTNRSIDAYLVITTGTVTATGTVTVDTNSSGSRAGHSFIHMDWGTANGTLILGSGSTPIIASTTALGSSGLVLNGSSATVKYTGASPQVSTTTYTTLTMNGSGSSTIVGGTVTASTLNVNTGELDTNNNSLSVTNSTASTTISNGAFLGVTSGTAGTVNFGNLIINSGGVFLNPANEAVGIAGHIVNNGTFTSGKGAYTLSGASKQITDNATTTFSGAVIINGSITNNNTTTIIGNITGTGSLTQAASAYLELDGASSTANSMNLIATAANNTVVFNCTSSAQTIASGTFVTLIIDTPGTEFTQGAATATTFTINSGTTFNTNNVNFAATTTSNGGTITVSGASGAPRFNGDITINSGGTFTNTANNDAVTVGGNFTNNGTVNAGSGQYTFSGSGKTWSGTTTFASVNITGTITNNGSTTVSTTLTGIGTLTNSASNTFSIGAASTTLAVFTASGAGNTVVYTGTNQTIATTTYSNLTLTAGGTSFIGPAALTVNGALTTGAGNTFNTNNQNVTIGGASTIGGTINFPASNTFNFADVTINSGGTWNNSANAGVVISGSIADNGTFTSGSGTYTLTGSSKTISGTATTSFAGPLTVNGTVTNNGTTTVTGTLGGSGTLTQGAGFYLEIDGASTTITSLAATASNNTVFYNGSTQTVADDTYYNLTVNSSGTAFLNNTTTSTNFTLSQGTLNLAKAFIATTTVISGGTFTVATSVAPTFSGDFTVNSGGTFTNTANNDNITFPGNFTNNGTFTAGSGTYTMNGSGKAISGTVSFTNLSVTGIITNNASTTVSGTLSGTGTTTQGSSGVLSLGALPTIAVLVASTTGNTVNYLLNSSYNVPILTYYNLGINRGTGTALTNLTLNSLSIASGGVFNASGTTLALTGTNTPLTVISGTFIASSSTVSFQATSSTSTVPSLTYYNLDFSPAAGTPVFQLSNSTLTVSNNFTSDGAGSPTIDANASNTPIAVTGTFAVGSGDTFLAPPSSLFTITGNFGNGGTFTHDGGTITFTPTATSTITASSSMTFNNIAITTVGKQLRFQKATANSPIFTIAGTLTVTGTNNNNIWLTSDTSGSQWLVHFNSAQSLITYANIKDGGCDSGTANANVSDGTSVDKGNNGTCWQFIISGAGAGSGGTSSSNNSTGGSGGGSQQSGGGAGSGSGGSSGSGGDGGGSQQSGGGGGGGGGGAAP